MRGTASDYLLKEDMKQTAKERYGLALKYRGRRWSTGAALKYWGCAEVPGCR
jgi:hypothetical protein